MSVASPPPATPVLDEPSALLSPTVLKAGAASPDHLAAVAQRPRPGSGVARLSPPRSPLRSPGGLSDLSRSPGKLISPRKA